MAQKSSMDRPGGVVLTGSDIARFNRLVTKLGPGECWPWKGCTISGGRGRFLIGGRGGKQVVASRVAYYLYHGKWPTYDALHTCDNPPCCNGAHIFDGTQLDNMRDKIAKNRQANGERQGASKLTEEKVLELRELYATGKFWIYELAEKYGVDNSTAAAVIRRRTWRHV